MTNQDGTIRLIFKPDTNQLLNNKDDIDGPCKLSQVNSIKECVVSKCTSNCKNSFFENIVKAVGDWATDAKSSLGNWSACEPLGLMTFEKKTCMYTIVLENLKPRTKYLWKVTIDNSFKDNMGN
jgi:hypothetical protein